MLLEVSYQLRISYETYLVMNRTGFTATNGDSQLMSLAYAYDSLSRLTSVTDGTDYDTIKVFVFDDMSSLKPICPLVTRDFNVK